MNRQFASLLMCIGLLVPWWLAGLAPAQSTADKSQMYEDIEIMCRILDHALHLPRHSTMMVPVNYAGNYGGFSGGISGLGGGLGGFQGGNGLGGGLGGSSINLRGLGGRTFGGSGAFAGGGGGFQGGNLAPVSFPVFPRTQGTYVKDHGVVFTFILPPPPQDRKATSVPSLPKPPSEWERIRKQLRGEKSESSPPEAKKKEPSVADLVLEALAKNGHHFSQLGERESLTVSIIFRPGEQPESGQALLQAAPVDSVYLTAELAAQEAKEASSPGEKQPTSGSKKPAWGSTPADSSADKGSSPRDYELLGDLHLKQGQSKDALQAYLKAVEKNRDPQQAAAMYLKIAQLYLTLENNEAEARKAMDQAREHLAKLGAQKKDTPKAKKPESPLPPRLIITVSKELLDRAGTGKISLEEFKKAATLEYLPFSQNTNPKR